MGELGRASIVVCGASALAVAALGLTSKDWDRAQLPVAAQTAASAQAVPPRLTQGFIGVLVSQNSLGISPRLEGSLTAVLVRIGQKVNRGDLLATVDSAPTRRELLISRARLATARAESSRVSLEHEQAVERAARAAKAALYLNSEEASAAVYATKLAASRQLAAEGQVMEQVARVEQLVAQLADCEITAPADGVIADRMLDSGALVDRRSVVLRMVSAEAPRVRFAVPEENIRDVFVGLRVRSESAAFHLALIGRVETVAPQLDPASRTLIAEAVLDPKQPGTSDITTGAVVRVFAEFPAGQPENIAPKQP